VTRIVRYWNREHALTDLAPEPPRQRNVTMIPRDAGRVIVRVKHPR
jgi:hypothetical protein